MWIPLLACLAAGLLSLQKCQRGPGPILVAARLLAAAVPGLCQRGELPCFSKHLRLAWDAGLASLGRAEGARRDFLPKQRSRLLRTDSLGIGTVTQKCSLTLDGEELRFKGGQHLFKGSKSAISLPETPEGCQKGVDAHLDSLA